MHTVLSIDASITPAQAVVIGVEEHSIKVLEHHSVILPQSGCKDELKAVLDSIRTQWHNLVLFFSPQETLSLNISLPFKEGKSIEKIIDMEVQDILPFELSDFIMHHRYIRPLPDKGEDIHAALVTTDRLSQLLQDARACDVEPYIVSTPGSALQGVYHITGTHISEKSFIILERPGTIIIAAFLDKKILHERTINSSDFNSDNKIESLNAQIALTISYVEKRYDISIDDVYLIQEVETPSIVKVDGKNITRIFSHDFVPLVPKNVSAVALFGSVFGQDYPAPIILSNFRTRSFAYSPRLTELVRGLKVLLPYFALLVAISVLSIIALYSARAFSISQMRKSLVEEIRFKIPEFTADPGTEATTLQAKASELQNALQELGSPLTSSPLELLSILSEDIPSVEAVDIHKISIRNGKVRIEGSTPNYGTQGKLESILKRKKKIFCNFDTGSSTTGSRDNTRDFQWEIKLCE